MTAIRKTGRHTLLQMYIQMVRELNALVLRPLDLQQYYDLPRLVGQHRVYRHHRFGRRVPGSDGPGEAVRLTDAAILTIAAESVPVTRRQNFLNTVGTIPVEAEKIWNLDETVYEYNPRQLQPISIAGRNGFVPTQMQIDDRIYSVDLFALPDGSFENDPGFTFDELMSS